MSRIIVVDVLEEERTKMNQLRQDNDEGLNNEPPEEVSERYLHMVETSTPI